MFSVDDEVDIWVFRIVRLVLDFIIDVNRVFNILLVWINIIILV